MWAELVTVVPELAAVLSLIGRNAGKRSRFVLEKLPRMEPDPEELGGAGSSLRHC